MELEDKLMDMKLTEIGNKAFDDFDKMQNIEITQGRYCQKFETDTYNQSDEKDTH